VTLARAVARRGGCGLGRAIALVAALFIGIRSDVAAQTGPPSEYHVKAVFLFNFAQFVEWPADAFTDPQAPVVVGILGDDPFGSFLDETVRGEHVGARPFEIRRFQRIADITACQLLFISQSEGDRVEEILASLKSRPILTVSDGDDFAERGGMIHFVTEKNHIRLRINLRAVEHAHLTLSSKLLRVAELVAATGR
jgi:hypothetical protein